MTIGSGIEAVPLLTGRNKACGVLRVLDLNIVRPVRERLHSRPKNWTTTSSGAFLCMLVSIECSVRVGRVRMKVLQVGLVMIERHLSPVGWLTVGAHHCAGRRVFRKGTERIAVRRSAKGSRDASTLEMIFIKPVLKFLRVSRTTTFKVYEAFTLPIHFMFRERDSREIEMEQV